MVVLQALYLVLMLYVLYFYGRSRSCRMCSNIPTLPGEWPILGHLVRVNFGIAKFNLIQETAVETEALGGIAKVWLGPIPLFILTDPKLALTVMNACLQKAYFYEFATSWVGKGIFTANVKRWKRTRRLINRTFSQPVLDSFLSVFNVQARRLVESLAPKAGAGEFRHHSLIAKNLLETVCQTTMGLSEGNNTIVDAIYMSCVDRIFEIIVSRVNSIWLHLDWIYKWSSLKMEEKKLVEFMKEESMKLLKLRKESLEAEAKTGNGYTQNRYQTFLELLLNLSEYFSEEEMAHEVDTMVVAGYDTSATTLMLYLVVIGSHPEVQSKIHDELRRVFGDTKRDVTKSDLCQLVYLEATLKEVMRLYPIGPAIMRTALENIKLETCTIPSGSHIILNIWGVNRSRCWGADANQFRPERWLDPATVPTCPAAFAAFGVGRRSCIGKTYAMMNMKTVLAHLLRHYTVKGDENKLSFKFALLLKPTAGHSISLEHQY